MSIRVLIVDDSAFVRDVLREVLSRFNDIEIVGEARDGRQACDLLPVLQPDVVTMDLVMPMIGGLECIELIMATLPTPVLVVADTESAEKLEGEALSAGAVGSFSKPSKGFDEVSGEAFARAIRTAAQIRPRRVSRRPRKITPADLARVRALGIVSSTGGPQMLAAFLALLKPNLPIAICIVQHTSVGFTNALVDWLAPTSPLPVRLATEGAILRPGEVVVAADDRHLEIYGGGRIRLSNKAPVGILRPSGDILLASLARSFGRQSAGLVCTGMGRDGSGGLRAIEDAGGLCLVQSPETAVVDSMPRSASKAVKSSITLDLKDLAMALQELRG